MKKIYQQPYSNKKFITAYYGKPPKHIFKHDVIKVVIPGQCKHCGNSLWFTPDEAADFIRALSAGLHHFLVNSKYTKKIIDAKIKADK